MSAIVYVLLASGLAFFTALTLAAFFWAVRTGQFRNVGDGAEVIFDRDEPVGAATDAFADERANIPLTEGHA